MGDMADMYEYEYESSIVDLDDDIFNVLTNLDIILNYAEQTKVKAILIGETKKAWLLKINNKQSWWPKSVCIFEDGMLESPNWLWNKKKEEII